MEKTVIRTGWDRRKKVLGELRYFPLFFVGLAPEYVGEYWCLDVRGDVPLYGGSTVFCVLVLCIGSFLFGANFGHQLLVDFWTATLSKKTVMVICMPFLVMSFVVTGFVIANVISIPFQFINQLRRKSNGM